MKKYLSILFVVAIMALCGVSFALAETTDVNGGNNLPLPPQNVSGTNMTAPTPDQVTQTKEEIQAQIAQVRVEAEQKIADLKTTAGKIKSKTKAQAAQVRILGREDALAKFDSAIEKLSTLKDNVNTRIAKFETQGMTVDSAKASVATADEKITQAQSKVAEVSTLLFGSLNELSKTDKIEFKQSTADIQTLVQDAHQSLNDAVSSLKGEVQNKIDASKANSSAEGN